MFEGKVSKIIWNNKTLLVFFIKKAQDYTRASNNQDVVASKFAITIPQVYVLTSNNAIRLRWLLINKHDSGARPRIVLAKYA